MTALPLALVTCLTAVAQDPSTVATDATPAAPPLAIPADPAPTPPPEPTATAEAPPADPPRARATRKPRRHRRPEPPAPVDLEVGPTRRFGVGIALGWPPSATLKVFVDPRNAVSLHVGTTLGTSGLHLRLQYEQSARRLRSWDWGELGIGWQAGFAVDFLFGRQASATAVRPGVLVGAHVELRLVPAPVAVFGEVSPILYPFDLAARQETSFFPVGLVIAVGGRWYF